MPKVEFNLDKFIKRIERQRVIESNDVELLVVLLTEALACEERLRAACKTAIEMDWHGIGAPHVYEQLRAALADEEEKDDG